MIKSKKGAVKFVGTHGELAADFTIIGRELRKVLPTEMVDHAFELTKLTKNELLERMTKNNG